MPKAKRTNGTDKLDDPTRWKKGKEDVVYTIEAILDKRTKGDTTEYLLKWKGPPQPDSRMQ